MTMNTTDGRFTGPERRHHKLFVTRNTEYYVRDGEVIGVRDLGNGRWLDAHAAMGMRIHGRVAPEGNIPMPGEPAVGERLYLASEDNDVITSLVVRIARPSKDVVQTHLRAA